MKKKAIVVALLTTLLLSGCNTTIPTMNTSEDVPQATEETTNEEDITRNWWKDKAFQSKDSGLYFWIEDVEEIKRTEGTKGLEENVNELWFMVGPEYLNYDNCLVIGVVDKSEISVKTEEDESGNLWIYYNFRSNVAYSQDEILICNNIVVYSYNEGRVLLMSHNELTDSLILESGDYYYVDTTKATEATETYEEPTEEPIEIPDLLSEPIYYECFETKGGWDSEIAIYPIDEVQIEVDIIRITGGDLSLDNMGENSRTYTGYWEDFDSQVSLTILESSPEIIFTATGELEQYNGTYIQIPDPGTDEEN